MDVCIFIDSSKGYKASTPLIHLLSLLTYLQLSYPFYTTFYRFLIVYFTFYLIFYIILLFSARLARSLYFSYLLLILKLRTYFLLLYTVSFSSSFDFRFAFNHSILTLILVPLLSPALLLRLCFFLFWPFLFPLSILRLFLSHLVFAVSFPPSFSPPPFLYCIYPMHVPMIFPLLQLLYTFSLLPFPSANLSSSLFSFCTSLFFFNFPLSIPSLGISVYHYFSVPLIVSWLSYSLIPFPFLIFSTSLFSHTPCFSLLRTPLPLLLFSCLTF